MNKIVEKIHSEFHNAFDIAAEKIQQVNIAVENGLAKTPPPLLIYDDIADMGFKSIREVNENQKRINNKNSLNSRKVSLTKFYEMTTQMSLYLNYRIITMPQVIQILEKYNLFIGPVNRYQGSMPRHAAEQLLNYKKAWNSYHRPDLNLNHRKITHAYFDETEPICAQNNGYNSGLSNINKLYICAPFGDFDKSKSRNVVGKEIFYNNEIKPPFEFHPMPPPPDPIVLNPLFFGDSWLDSFKFMHVAAAWGVEAKEVVNPTSN